VPATRTGGLSRALFPRPGELGPRWAWWADEGDAEEGYVGNGTPVLARDPAEVALTLVPFGCPATAARPVGDHALEAGYRYAGHRVIAVRVAFSSRALAVRSHQGRAAALERCDGVVPDRATGPLVTEVTALGRRTLTNARTPSSDPYVELATVSGSDTVLVALRGSPDDPRLGPLSLRRLARAFSAPRP